MNDYFSYYSLYDSLILKIIRGILYVIFLILICYSGFYNHPSFFKILAFFVAFLINEIFVIYKINRAKPHEKVGGSSTVESMLFDARIIFDHNTTPYQIARHVIKHHEIQFFLKKIEDIPELSESEISKESLLKIAAQLVRTVKGFYITSIDLFVAYLFLTEGVTHFLEQTELTEEDIVNILYWTRNTFHVDNPGDFRIIFTGSGVFDSLVFGWTTELKKYSIDLTAEVLHARTPPIVVGRAKEYKELVVTLSKSNTNNAIIVGHPGTGRTSLVRLLAYQSHLGLLPPHISHKNFYEVLTDRLLASVGSAGELEERLGTLLSEIEHAGHVALFIQNIENIFGGGGFSFDMTGILFPYLKNGTMPVIGTTTPGAYKTYLERRETIESIFDVIHLDEPDQNTALFMLFEKVGEIEKKANVSLTYSAVSEAISLSSSYLLDTYLPGKAITLLESVVSEGKIAGKNLITKHDVIAAVEAKTKILLEKPTASEEQILLHMEDEIHKRLINQEEAVRAIAVAMRRLRSGFVNKKRPISVFLFLGPTGVGKTETAKALAALYFGDENRMIRLDMSEYQTQDSLPRLLGGMYEGTYSGTTLADRIRENPFSMLLLDEFEKAHPRVLDLFLQVFDEGRLTDNQGRTIPFQNTIIIATSNAGSEEIREKISDKNIDLKKNLTEYLLRNGIFRPELLNRFDEVVVYKPLSVEHAKEVAKLLLLSELKELEEKQIFIMFEPNVLDKVVKEGYSEEFGARNLRRYITQNIEDMISRLILEEKIKKGDHVTLDIDANGEFVLR